MNKILFILKDLFLNCKSKKMINNKYTFQENNNLKEMITYLNQIKYKIIKQVLNHQNHIIGLIVQSPTDKGGFLPIKPSGINRKYEIILSDHIQWNDYTNTVNFLKEMNILSRGKILSTPEFKVEEDGLIVGFLTQTNQFVMINPPNENFEDGIKTIKGYNYVILDKLLAESDDYDVDRENMIKKIKLESQFFNIFRNTIRILLQKYKYKKFKALIIKTINGNIKYLEKITIIIRILKKLVENHINFVILSPKIINNIDTLSICLNLDKDKCGRRTYCLGESDNCKLLIPSEHLISGHKNEKIYFGRIADEFIRYGRIRQFMLEPNHYINFIEVGYNLKTDEIILFENILTEGYFNDLIPSHTNPYLVHRKTRFDSQPQDYKEVKFHIKDTCLFSSSIKGNEWKGIFNKEYIGIFFKDTPICTWKLLLLILFNDLNEKMEITDLKKILWEEYKDKDEQELLNTLAIQGKNNIVSRINAQQISIETVIFSILI